MSPLRTSLCAHDVPNHDVPVEDTMSPSRMSPLRTFLCGHKVHVEDVLDGGVPTEDLMSAQGHDVIGRMSLRGHHVPDEDVLNLCYGLPCKGPDVH